MRIKESGENYLETILLLETKQGMVRSVDIALELDYSKPSISRAMGILKQEGYIRMETNGNILLTDEGREKANRIYERHLVISNYLIKALGVDEKTAGIDACRIEHVISESSFEKIREWIKENG